MRFFFFANSNDACTRNSNFAVIYLVDITEVPDFNKMYELYDPCTTMFFFRNKHIMVSDSLCWQGIFDGID